MRGLWLIGTVGAVVLGLTGTAMADTLHVHNTNDDGGGSLRRALDDANPGDVIKVPGGHYVVSSGELTVSDGIKIKGAGARKSVLDANRDSRVMAIGSALGQVKISGLTVREGDTEGMGDGAGIEAGGGTELVLNRVAILDNHAINDTSFSNGGGVDSGDQLIIKRSLFAGNHGYNGGAADAPVIRATDSTFFNNFGGNPTFNGDGGAFDTDVVLTDSSVVGNQCFNGDGCGGGSSSGTEAKGTIFAGNRAYMPNGMPPGSAGNPGTPDNCASQTIDSMGHNLDDRHDCGLAGPGDISDKSARLRDLENNGGPTNTLALKSSSPAVNAGARNCTAADQRGVHRPQGPRCDIGAFELNH